MALQLANRLLLTVPVVSTLLAVVVVDVPWTREIFETPGLTLASWSYLSTVLWLSLALFTGAMIVSLIFVTTIPRLLNLALKPDRVYPLYGIHYLMHVAIGRITNRKFFHELFGDSSFIVPYLQRLGYRLSPVVQTGSNFGTEIKHDNPYLSRSAAELSSPAGISFINANYSSTSFSVSRSARRGKQLPRQRHRLPPAVQGRPRTALSRRRPSSRSTERSGRASDCSGSPAFEIPRTVLRDSQFIRMAVTRSSRAGSPQRTGTTW